MLAAPESYRLGEHHLHYNPSISPAYELKIDFSQSHIDATQARRSNTDDDDDDDEDDDNYDGLPEEIFSSPSSPRHPKTVTTVEELLSDEEDLLMLYYGEENKDQECGTPPTTSTRTSCGADKGQPAEATPTKKLFDLTAFAQALYDTRLSVIQGDGDEKLLLSEEDEQVHAKLVALRRESIAYRNIVEVAEDNKIELMSLQASQEVELDTTTIDTPASTISSPTQSSSNLSRSSRFKELFDVDISKVQPTLVGVAVVSEDETPVGTVITKDQRRAKATRSLGLFGSLRQVTNRTRSQSASSIRGLMRSISTGRSRSNSGSRNSTNANSTTPQRHHISPAGLATLQHPAATNNMQQRRQQQQRQSGEPTNNNKGIRLLSQLVGRVKRTTSSCRPTKKINMSGCSNNDERSRLVRRTIIYVQPDSENFFKTLGELEEEPTQPKRAHMDNGVSGQSLEGVEMREMSDGSVTWGVIKKQGRRKSFFDPHESKCEINDDDEETEEQIEERVLALMGLRPDFLKDFQPNPPQHHFSSSSVPARSSPPPIPARSPFRHQQEEATHIHTTSNQRDHSTTDIYYAPNSTLPSLLQMISEQDEKLENPSVEEQLDEVIRSFSSSSDCL